MPDAPPHHRSDRWCGGRRPVPPRCSVRHPMATIGRVTSRQLARVSGNEKRAAIIRNGLAVCNKAGRSFVARPMTLPIVVRSPPARTEPLPEGPEQGLGDRIVMSVRDPVGGVAFTEIWTGS